MRDDHTLEALRHQAMDDPEVPARVREMLRAGAALEEIRLDASGRWTHQGDPFVHKGLIRLFYRHLQRTTSGTWTLQIPPYTYPVVVEGTGRFIVRIDGAPPDLEGIELDDQAVPLQPDRFVCDGHTFLGVELPGGQLARCVQSAYHDVLDRVELDESGRWQVRWGTQRWPMAEMPHGWPCAGGRQS